MTRVTPSPLLDPPLCISTYGVAITAYMQISSLNLVGRGPVGVVALVLINQ